MSEQTDSTETVPASEDRQTLLLETIFKQVSDDISLLLDHELEFDSFETEFVQARPAGEGAIHISFRMSFGDKKSGQHGCLLVPLPDALTLAAFLLEIPEASISAKRQLQSLDDGLKDAMVELGNMIGGSAASGLRTLGLENIRVRFAGCQGVRAGVRPAMTYKEGDTLVVGRAKTALEGFPAFQVMLILPELDLTVDSAK